MRNLLSRESTETNLLPNHKIGKAGYRNFESQNFVRTRSAIVQPTIASDQITHDSHTGIQQPNNDSPRQAPAKVNTSFASSFMASLRRKPKHPGTQQHQTESSSMQKTTPGKKLLMPTNTPSTANTKEDEIVGE